MIEPGASADTVARTVRELSDQDLHNLAEVVRQVQIERAIALVPLVDGTELDAVTGKARSGQHSVDHVVSYEVHGGELVEVSQRKVTPANMR